MERSKKGGGGAKWIDRDKCVTSPKEESFLRGKEEWSEKEEEEGKSHCTFGANSLWQKNIEQDIEMFQDISFFSILILQ